MRDYHSELKKEASKLVHPDEVNHRRRVAIVSDLVDFVRVGDTLVHKSNKDLWRLSKDGDGNDIIERLFKDEEVLRG